MDLGTTALRECKRAERSGMLVVHRGSIIDLDEVKKQVEGREMKLGEFGTNRTDSWLLAPPT